MCIKSLGLSCCIGNMHSSPCKYSIELYNLREHDAYIYWCLNVNTLYIKLNRPVWIVLYRRYTPKCLLFANFCYFECAYMMVLWLIVLKLLTAYIYSQKLRKIFPCMPGRNSLAHYTLQFLQNEMSCSHCYLYNTCGFHRLVHLH